MGSRGPSARAQGGGVPARPWRPSGPPDTVAGAGAGMGRPRPDARPRPTRRRPGSWSVPRPKPSGDPLFSLSLGQDVPSCLVLPEDRVQLISRQLGLPIVGAADVGRWRGRRGDLGRVPQHVSGPRWVIASRRASVPPSGMAASRPGTAGGAKATRPPGEGRLHGKPSTGPRVVSSGPRAVRPSRVRVDAWRATDPWLLRNRRGPAPHQ